MDDMQHMRQKTTTQGVQGAGSANGALRVVHYVNQFFGQLGGEERAGAPLSVREGPVGPGLAVQAALGAAGRVAATVICGDNHMAEALEERSALAAKSIAGLGADLVLAGPAFGAGRYGMACGAVCKAVGETLAIPAVAAMHESNPAVALFRSHALLVPAAPTASGMKKAVEGMVAAGLRLCRGEYPAKDDYFSQRLRITGLKGGTGAGRAADMLLLRLLGRNPESEVPLFRFEKVAPAPPLERLDRAVVVPVTEGGLSPSGNPDRLEASMATRFGTYSIAGLDRFSPEAFQVSHGGYDNSHAQKDPNRLLPLDALRELERLGEIGALSPVFYSTAGNATSVENAARFGREIAEDIRKRFQGQAGVFLTST